MLKKFILRFIILLLISIAGYSGFWFYKANEYRSYIVKILQDNAFYVSSSSIKFYGFPLQNNITINNLSFSLPFDSLSSHRFNIESLKISADLFSSNYTVSEINKPSYVSDSGAKSPISFSKKPQINLAILPDNLVVSYKDQGHKITSGLEDDVLYTASGMNINISSKISKSGKISTSFQTKISDSDSVKLSNLYQDGLEPDIIDALSSGEIEISKQQTLNDNKQDFSNDNAINDEKEGDIASEDIIALDEDTSDLIVDVLTDADLSEFDLIREKNIIGKIESAISDINIDLSYELLPNSNAGQMKIDSDPTKIRSIPVQYSKSLEINNFSITNDLYQIFISGKMQSYFDDPSLSGLMKVKVIGALDLIDYISDVSSNMTSNNLDILEGGDIILSNVDNSFVGENDHYNNFLLKISNNIDNIVKEISNTNKKDVKIANKQDVEVANQEIEDLAQDDEVDKEYEEEIEGQVEGQIEEEVELTDIAEGASDQEVGQNQILSKKIEEEVVINDEISFTISREKNLEYMINNIPVRQIIEEL